MFRVVDRAITPKKDLYDRAIKRLPTAHQAAHEAGVRHLHARVSEDASRSGLNPEGVQVLWHRQQPYLGIAATAAGDELADQEYGTPEDAPSPVLRNSVRRHHGEASHIYAQTLQRHLGL